MVNVSSFTPFSVQWQERNAAVVEKAMVATITVSNPGTPVYDPVTDTWTDTETVAYGPGKARVQPLRSSRWVTPAGNAAPVLTVLFSIPISSRAVLKVGQEVKVSASPLNPDLLRYTFVVFEMLDSQNPIERTFYATVNQESV